MEIYNFNINNNPYEVKIVSIKGILAVVEVNGVEFNVDISDIGDLIIPTSTPKPQQAAPQTRSAAPAAAPAQTAAPVAAAGNSIVSPMPGQVQKILVSPGDSVKVGDIVVTIEAMKMENQIRSTMDGTIASVLVSEGDVVAEGAPLVTLGG
jgi:glutaconyl-CoA/methylmalonyl-CoA decarboxylase subunit gamma